MADEEGNNAEAVLDAPGGGGPDAPVGLNVPGDQIAALQDQLQALKLQYASAQASFETQLEAAKQPKMTVVAQAVAPATEGENLHRACTCIAPRGYIQRLACADAGGGRR